MADTFEQYASDNVMVPPGDRWHVGNQFDIGGMQFKVLETTVSTAIFCQEQRSPRGNHSRVCSYQQ